METYDEKGMTTVPSSTFAADETPSLHVRPFLRLFQCHDAVVIPRSRGKVVVVVAVVRGGELRRMSGAVEMVPVPYWKV